MKVNIMLNGSRVQADTSETILDVARRNDVYIPTLCHEDRLEPTGSCRVCLVAVEGARNHVPACSTKIADGMIIDTENPEVMQARHMSLALLMSDHYGDCISPCSRTCPAHIDIQGYIALIAAGRYNDAVALIREKIAMPLSIGRICPHPCESECRRNRVEEPIAINNLKRFVADYGMSQETPLLPEKKPANRKKVAVIGSGPAGLSAAYYLALRGYRVTIFEKETQAGGMLRYGIPEYRLPKKVLDTEIRSILSLGIDLICKTEFGRDITAVSLKKDFDAVFLGIGAQKSIKMRIEGEDSPGVLSGIDFLHEFASGRKFDFNNKMVVVVGGGNTAMDASRTARRLGASKVIVLYRRTRKEMPANDSEIREAEEEGIEFRFLSAPVRLEQNGAGIAAECIRMELGEPDASGRRRPVPIAGSNYRMETDYIITAIGQRPDSTVLAGLDLVTARDLVRADAALGTTDIDYLFAAGDCVTGAATAVEAIAGGRRTAESIDFYIKNGRRPESRPTDFDISKGALREIPDSVFAVYEKAPRVVMPAVSPGRRVGSFEEIETGISEEQARREAARCLECGCIAGFSCDLRTASTRYGVTEDEYSGEKNIYPEKNILNTLRPPIEKDPNKCIKCGICVRICDEVWGLNIFGFKNRGFHAEVTPYFDLDLGETACDYCGQCADACPTGALALNTNLPKPGPFEVKKINGRCTNCSLGCELEWNIYGGRLVQTTGIPVAGENEGNLCMRGRFGFGYLHAPSRRLDWFTYSANGLQQTNAEPAFEYAAGTLSKGKRVGILTSTDLSNEEYERIYLLSEQLDNASVFHIPWDFAETPGTSLPVLKRSRETAVLAASLKTASLTDIASSDTVLLFNIQPGRSYPILEMKIRHAVKKGVRLYIVDRHPLRLDGYADSVFRIRRERYQDFFDLIGYLQYLNSSGSRSTDEYYKKIKIDGALLSEFRFKWAKIFDLVRNLSNKSCIFIADEDTTEPQHLKPFIMNALLQADTTRLLLMSRGMNPGGALLGISGKTGLSGKTGHVCVDEPEETDTVRTIDSMFLEQFDTLLLYKLPNPFSDTRKNVVHIGFEPGSYKRGVFIPASSILETGGSRYLYNGEISRMEPVVHNETHLDNVKTINTLIARVSGR